MNVQLLVNSIRESPVLKISPLFPPCLEFQFACFYICPSVFFSSSPPQFMAVLSRKLSLSSSGFYFWSVIFWLLCPSGLNAAFLSLISSSPSELDFLLLYPNVGRREKNLITSMSLHLRFLLLPLGPDDVNLFVHAQFAKQHLNHFLFSLYSLSTPYFTISHCPWVSLSHTKAQVVPIFLIDLIP